MQETTMADRESELRSLLAQMDAHPERDWSEEKLRVAVLREMLDGSDTATSGAEGTVQGPAHGKWQGEVQ